jgi:hypothetical protein
MTNGFAIRNFRTTVGRNLPDYGVLAELGRRRAPHAAVERTRLIVVSRCPAM